MIALYPIIIAGMVWCVAALGGAALSYSNGYFSNAVDSNYEGPEYDTSVEEDEDGNQWVVHERIDDGPDISAYEADWDEVRDEAVATANDFIATYWPAIFGAVGCWFLIAAAFHTNMIRMLSHARPVTRSQEPELYNLLENLCISRGMAAPKLEIIETDARNAFASGIDEKSYSITLTRGLLESLDREEIEAVLGHELTHIMNNDVRLLIISIIFTGMVGFICQLYWSFIRHALAGRGQKDGRAMMALMAVGCVLLVGYFITTLTRYAISRRREFMADAGAVELTKNPEALMRALLRIAGADYISDSTESVAMMCIENSHRFLGMFSTHPSLDDRLNAIAGASQLPLPAINPGSRASSTFQRQRQGVSGGALKNPWA